MFAIEKLDVYSHVKCLAILALLSYQVTGSSHDRGLLTSDRIWSFFYMGNSTIPLWWTYLHLVIPTSDGQSIITYFVICSRVISPGLVVCELDRLLSCLWVGWRDTTLRALWRGQSKDDWCVQRGFVGTCCLDQMDSCHTGKECQNGLSNFCWVKFLLMDSTWFGFLVIGSYH